MLFCRQLQNRQRPLDQSEWLTSALWHQPPFDAASALPTLLQKLISQEEQQEAAEQLAQQEMKIVHP
jgi:hypothetical protein